MIRDPVEMGQRYIKGDRGSRAKYDRAKYGTRQNTALEGANVMKVG
jgi:hypothetical protein